MKKLILKEFDEAAQLLEKVISNNHLVHQIEEAAELLSSCILNEGKIIVCGNGGSHCDAMHFAEELSGKYRENRRALPAIAISDPSHLSCVSNDFGYQYVFSRFVEAFAKKEDILLGISTSGNSENVIEAFKTTKSKNIKTIALTGNDGGKLASLADIEIRVPHIGYADRTQEIHIKIIHILILLIEKHLNLQSPG